MPPTLRNVFRLDSLPLNQTYYTTEGYLVDRPIVTSVGIFEYQNPDGSVRRELRLPEDVFAPESLKSYKGKPVIVTHDAGLITKDNVGREEIGTILSEGYRSGNDVRAEIIIHDTNAMKAAGLKELSLGYNLDLDETPGEWNGQPYDAIQRNIRINHLALVREARAGEQARLNIDSREQSASKGEHKMQTVRTSHHDGVLSPEELKKAVEEYKARRAKNLSANQGDEDDVTVAPIKSADPAVPDNESEKENRTTEVSTSDGSDAQEAVVSGIKASRDTRKQSGDPTDKEAAMGVIAQQDEDMGILFDIIDTLLAERDFGGGAKPAAASNQDEDDKETQKPDGANGGEPPAGSTAEPANSEGEAADAPKSGSTEKLNADSVDQIVRQRIQLGMIGQKLNMDGLENMSIIEGKKAVIRAVRPAIRLDGKSAAYIDAAFDLARTEVERLSVKDTSYQKRQMFNADSGKQTAFETSASEARQRMINRMSKKKEDK